MAKKGMKRPDETKIKETSPTVPESVGKKKNSKQKAKPTNDRFARGVHLKVSEFKEDNERPISSAYKAIDTDLARDNLENDIPEADLGEV